MATATAKPILSAVGNDGIVVDGIAEEDLFKHTSHRWVYDEERRLAERYLKFNVQELLKAAVAAVSGTGATRCTKVLRCKEGFSNKALLLEMDNGVEIFAKLPNPSAGPAFYTTASEVATRTFLREALDLPIPQILAWSADRNNPVGAEYIIEEKAPGKPLSNFWPDLAAWPLERRFPLMRSIVEVEWKLASILFAKSGCIYFRKDIPGSEALETITPMPLAFRKRFTMGPLVARELWKGEKEGMDLNRGPFEGSYGVATEVAKNEIKFIKEHGRPRIVPALSLTEPESPDRMLDLLDHYLKLVPAMAPPEEAEDAHSPTLWHTDLHSNNVFVDPVSKKITRILDWQSASILPFFAKCSVPPLFRDSEPIDPHTLPKRPANYSSLEPHIKKYIDDNIALEMIHRHYIDMTSKKNVRHFVALALHNDDDVRLKPAAIVQSVWEKRDVFFFQRALMRIVDRWGELCPGKGPCPVRFSLEEMAMYAREEGNRKAVVKLYTMVHDAWGLSREGSIDPGRFEEV
ncbi:Altered inheritance of mitochondria protein, partial [Lachnellula suecica]